MSTLPGLPNPQYTGVNGVSADGSIMVGYSVNGGLTHAIRWGNGIPTDIGTLTGDAKDTTATAVSDNGNYIVGQSLIPGGFQAFRWQEGNMLALGELEGRKFFSSARGISPYGTIVVGESDSFFGREAFLWSEENGMIGLGDLTGGDFYSIAYDASINGEHIVGFGTTTSGIEAFLWTQETGMINLADTLINDYGLDLTGWELKSAIGISNNGTVIAGSGINPNGQVEGWIATIPALPPIEVPMKFTPQALNLSSSGKWVKAHFVLPEDFDVNDVDANTPAVIAAFGIESDYIDVFINEDGFVEIEAAFSRADFCGSIIGNEPVEVNVTGTLTTGQQFYGTDTIRITNNNLEYLTVLSSHWLRTDCGQPDWCSGADLNRDSVVNFVDFALLDR
ncbi:MAG: hypothetical protein ACYS1A_14810 [Planctomycetota bacterium]